MEEKMGFVESVKNMFVGVARPALYMVNGLFAGVGHLILVVCIVNVILYLVIFYLPYNKLFGDGRLADRVDSAVGDFTLTQDGFSYGDVFEWSDDEGLSYIRIDTSRKNSDADEAQSLVEENGYSTVLLISSQDVMAYRSGSAQTIKCKDIYGVLNEANPKTAFAKQDVLDVIEKWDTPVLIIVYVFEIIAGIVGTVLWSLVISVAGLIAASSKKIKVSLGSVLKASIYIRMPWYTLMMIIGTYLVPASSVCAFISFVISVVYICIAVTRHDWDFMLPQSE